MSVRLDHGEDTLVEVHEINVTPFIDVMLVLLIIFMVAAPLATVDRAGAAASGQAAVPDDQARPVAFARRRSHSPRRPARRA
jgi:biopolymer transport protein ExbD